MAFCRAGSILQVKVKVRQVRGGYTHLLTANPALSAQEVRQISYLKQPSVGDNAGGGLTPQSIG